MSKILTKELRESIIHHCVSATFSKRKEAQVKALQKWARDLRTHEFGKDLKILYKVAGYWLNRTYVISIQSPYVHSRKADGHLCKVFSMGEYLPMPSRHVHPDRLIDAIVDDSHPLCERLIALAKEESDIYEAEQSLRSNLSGLLSSCRTLKTLRETWPEGAKFIPAEPVPIGSAVVPVALKSDINKAMGLK